MSNRQYIKICLIPFAFLIVAFEILPLMSIVAGSLGDGHGGYSLIQYKNAITSRFYMQGIANSFRVSIISAVVATIISVAGSYSIRRLAPKIRDAVMLISNMTSNFSGIPLAFAFIVLIGNNGVVTIIMKMFGLNLRDYFNLYSIAGLTMVYTYFLVPLGILLMYPAYDGIKKEWEEAALILGATRIEFWRHIGIPAVFPSIMGTMSILFANALGAYASAVALTSGNINLLSIRIGALVSGDINLNPELASALAVILGMIVVFTNLVSQSMTRGRRRARK
ncbi:MAG: transporter permease [Firmicutes bacterium]|nr:transporter permease [Bacillota bacterium]